jgi:hypothetical protein
VFFLLIGLFVVGIKSSEKFDFFPEHYIPLLFHCLTASSTTPLHITQHGTCQPVSQLSASRHLQVELLLTGGAEINVYP